ncbi:MAG: metal-sensing transcriptional repressor [Gemmatimonas sp.]
MGGLLGMVAQAGAAGGCFSALVLVDITPRWEARGVERIMDFMRAHPLGFASVHEALRAVGRELMRNHLKHCASEAIRQGPAEADAMYDELVAMMYRTSR